MSGTTDVLVRGELVDGFALIAFPAQYGLTGVQTFMVSHNGALYKNLGPDTAAIARKMTRFEPDASWRKIEPA
jgi:Protein of unknown function (DUF2950)